MNSACSDAAEAAAVAVTLGGGADYGVGEGYGCNDNITGSINIPADN